MRPSGLERRCQQVGHEQNLSNIICINRNCTQQRLLCFTCSKIFHDNHNQELLAISEFNIWWDQTKNINDQVLVLIKSMEDDLQKLSQLVQEYRNSHNFNFHDLTTKEVSNQINKMIMVKSIHDEVLQKGQEVNLNLRRMHDLIYENQQQAPQVLPEKQQINKSDSAISIILFQMQPPLIGNHQSIQFQQQYQNLTNSIMKFKFSQLDKERNILVSLQGNKIEAKHWQTWTCSGEPAFPLHGEGKFAIKINRLENGLILVGVCEKQFSLSNKPVLKSFALSNQGTQYFQALDKIANNDNRTFNYKVNDVIIVITNNKTVTWKKKTGETCSIQFKNQADLFPYIYVEGTSEVKICK